jgi:D-psicose/D-tagatose/L-ribulose 3-epimerase
MMLGTNTFIWTSPFSTSTDLWLVDHAHALGADVFEIAVEDPNCIDVAALKQALVRSGMQASVCGVFGPERDLSSDDPATRATAEAYIRWCVDAAETLGSPIFGGPMYTYVGKARLLPPDERAAERARAVAGLRTMADYAASKGVRLALEILNRFETDMLNTAAQGMALLDEVDRPNVGLHLDTFHMHVEEKNSAEAIRLAGARLFHFHACENDRGVPGTGQVHWPEIAQALDDINYQGLTVIESFTPSVTSIARAVNLWRPLAPSQDAIAGDGLRFLRGLLAGVAVD